MQQIYNMSLLPKSAKVTTCGDDVNDIYIYTYFFSTITKTRLINPKIIRNSNYYSDEAKIRREGGKGKGKEEKGKEELILTCSLLHNEFFFNDFHFIMVITGY